MNTLEYVRTLLINASLLETTIGDLPTDKDACISLFQVTGTMTGYFCGRTIQEPLIRIVLRYADYATGLARIDTILNCLNRYHDSTILSSIVRNAGTFLGKDDKRRNVWEMTFLIRR